MVVRTPSLVYIYIYLSIVSRNYMNEKLRFFSFSLSQHGIRAKEENLILSYFPCHQLQETFFPVSRVINSGKPSGDCVSFRSPSPSPNTFRSVGSSSENTHRRRTFPTNFFRHRPHQEERLEEISNFFKSIGAKKPSMRRPRALLRPATESHAPAREGA